MRMNELRFFAWRPDLWFEWSAHVCAGYTTKNQPPLSPRDIKLIFSIDTSVLFNPCRNIEKNKKEFHLCVHVRSRRQTTSRNWESDDLTNRHHRGEELASSAICVFSVIKHTFFFFSFSFPTPILHSFFFDWLSHHGPFLIYLFVQRIIKKNHAICVHSCVQIFFFVKDHTGSLSEIGWKRNEKNNNNNKNTSSKCSSAHL